MVSPVTAGVKALRSSERWRPDSSLSPSIPERTFVCSHTVSQVNGSRFGHDIKSGRTSQKYCDKKVGEGFS